VIISKKEKKEKEKIKRKIRETHKPMFHLREI